MNGLVVIGLAIALASIWGSAYLLSLWHEDQRDMIAHGQPVSLRTWPVSRVIADLAVGACISANVLGFVTILRLGAFPGFVAIRDALLPLVVPSLVYLDLAFVILAAYLRIVRARSGQRLL